MKLEDLKVGQIVDIIYVTEMNGTPKRRNLTNLEITEILDRSVKFIQHKEKPRKWWINNNQIIRIFEVK
jgi:hypothetical protein